MIATSGLTGDASGSVLFVDNDRSILGALKREFGASKIRTFTAEGAAPALDILAREKIDIIVTDFRMPDKNGMELLQDVLKLYPSVSRIIFSGFIDHEILLRSLSSGWATVFFTKPWDSRIFERKLGRVLRIKRALEPDGLFSLLNTVNGLPASLAVYSELATRSIARLSPAAIVGLVERDPAIVLKLLQVANSFDSGRGAIYDAAKAFAVLGTYALDNIVLNLEIAEQRKWDEDRLKRFTDLVVHFRLLSKYVSAFQDGPFPFSVVCGVIGRLLLFTHFYDRYRAIDDMMRSDPVVSFGAVEKKLFPAEHTSSELGGLFLDLWNLPSSMIEAAYFADEPGKASEENRTLVETIGAVDAVFRYVRIVGSIEGIERAIPACRRTDVSRIVDIAARALEDLRHHALE